MKVSPATVTVAVGRKQVFKAKGADAFGNPVVVDDASWSVTPATLGSVKPPTGASTTFTASATPGSGYVVASAGGITGRSSVTVTG